MVTANFEHSMPAGFKDEPWIGDRFAETGVLVLGESWYGDWGAEHNSDKGYVQAYLDGLLADAMYTRMANACGQSREMFWHQVMFTNFVIWAGALRTHRPTTHMYLDAYVRLERLIEQYRPKGVWLLGKGQAEFSSHVLMRMGIPFEVTPHPTSYGVKNEVLKESWMALQGKISTPSQLAPAA